MGPSRQADLLNPARWDELCEAEACGQAFYAPEPPSFVCGSSEVDVASDPECRGWQMANLGQSLW
jgi:hypothetical protein